MTKTCRFLYASVAFMLHCCHHSAHRICDGYASATQSCWTVVCKHLGRENQFVSVMQVYVMTNKWQFKAVQRMDLGSDSNHGISLSSQKSNAGTNGTAVTASGMNYLHEF
jgi:hypothetical protein